LPTSIKNLLLGEESTSTLPVYSHPFLYVHEDYINPNARSSQLRVHTQDNAGKTQVIGNIQTLSSANLAYMYVWS
jgi:hypothetical protein